MSAGSCCATSYRSQTLTPPSHGSAPATAASSSPDRCTFSDEAASEVHPTPAPPQHHSSSGGGILGDVGGFFSGAANTVASGASDAWNGATGTAGHLLDGASNAVQSGLGKAGNFLGGIGKSIYLAPFQLLAGKHDIPAPGLPAYPHLNPAQKQAAMRPGQTVPQPVIRDSGGGHHEPVSLMYHGPLNKLEKALSSQGWEKPSVFPISSMSVNGKPQVLALQKNAQLGGLSRDHLRVFQMGNNQYGIAATRDLQPFVRVHSSGSLSFGHETDPNVDGERDLIMQDVLHADPSAAQSWRVVQGVPQYQGNNYRTDGQVYEFSL